MTTKDLAAQLITNPFVIRCAWQKTVSWYATTEWAPEPEWSEWQRDPWAKLVPLAETLAADGFVAGIDNVMRQVPYPKQGAQVRHYVLPSVDTQVAHMIFAVLLAPFIEARLANVNFGSRWYRGLRRTYPEGRERGQWERKPFSLADRALFNPYKRDYGLFRRLATWTAGAFLRADLDDGVDMDDEAAPVKQDDYSAAMLPYLPRGGFRLAQPGKSGLCYARLDLTKAYPSIHRADVRSSLLKLLAEKAPLDDVEACRRWDVASCFHPDLVSFLPAATIGSTDPLENPWRSLAGKAGEPVRRYLGKKWMDLLEAATYEPDSGPFDLGPVIDQEFFPGQAASRNRFGLPTGLAVSPLLMNVALSRLDYQVLTYLQESESPAGLTAAYLRFADDIVLFAQDEPVLRQLLGRLMAVLQGYKGYGRDLRPQLNWKKAKPSSVAAWGRAHDARAQIALEEGDFITADNRVEFVTALVQRMSGLAMETILERRGRHAFTKLSRLQELGRWDIKDVEVRKDTRLVYVANKLARAWVPSTGDAAAQGRYVVSVRGIRATIRKAIIEVPWKFSLWRYAIQAALRSEPGGHRPMAEGIEWLRSLLEVLQVEGAWSKDWVTEDLPEAPKRAAFSTRRLFDHAVAAHQAWERHESGGLRAARVSFVRAHFWREFAKIVRQLGNVKLDGASLHPSAWFTRAIGPHALSAALSNLETTDQWAEALYGPNPGQSQLPWWEVDAIEMAIAACRDNVAIRAARGAAAAAQPELDMLLEIVTGHGADPAALLHRKVGTAPYSTWPLSAQMAVVAGRAESWLDEPSVLALWEAGIKHIEKEWQVAFKARRSSPAAFFRLLDFYRHLRMALLAYDVPAEVHRRLLAALGITPDASIGPTLRRAVWGLPSDEGLQSWPIVPTVVPAVGLPIPWALQVFGDLVVGDGMPPSSEVVVGTPWVTSFEQSRRKILRDWCVPSTPEVLVPSAPGPVCSWAPSAVFPPHPCSFFPSWFGWDEDRTRLWHASFNLFLAIDGTEQFHDRVWNAFLTQTSWSENLMLRCEKSLPSFVWTLIDIGMGAPVTTTRQVKAITSIRELAAEGTLMPLGCEEVVTSIRLDPQFPVSDSSHYLEVATRDEPLTGLEDYFEIERTVRRGYSLNDDLKLRIAQISAQPAWNDIPENWPCPSHLCDAMHDQVLHGLESLESNRDRKPAEVIIFPELALHPDEADAVARYAAKHGAGLLSGLFWRALPSAVLPARESTQHTGHRYFVNEAILSIPHLIEPALNQPYVFRIRKPRPAHIEYGVQEALSTHDSTPGRWRILPGQEWLRFEHPKWGPLAIAICSDLLDVKPWARLKGSILHLLMVAWNDDVELYDSMTRARAYELYVNVVSVNHGLVSGSMAWVPVRGREKNLFTVKGGDHFVMSDVLLPVKRLAAEQGEPHGTDVRRMTSKARKMLGLPVEDDLAVKVLKLLDDQDLAAKVLKLLEKDHGIKYQARPSRFVRTWHQEDNSS